MLITGKDRLTFLNKLLTNDLLKLVPGQGLYSFLLQRTGRILIDLNVLHEEEATLLEVDIRLTKALTEELERYRFSEDVPLSGCRRPVGPSHRIGARPEKLLNKMVEGGVAALNEPGQRPAAPWPTRR